LLCLMPPTQSSPALAPAVPTAIAPSTFATPSPEPTVSQLAKSGGISSTRVTVPVDGSTSLTWPVWFGSFVMKCVTYTFPSGPTATARGSGQGSWMLRTGNNVGPSTTSVPAPWHATYSWEPSAVAAMP